MTGQRREQLKGLALGIPVALIANLITQWVGYFSDNTWGVAAALLPLAVVTWFLGKPLYKDRRLVLGGGFIPFFLCYVLLFSLATTSEVLAGKRIALLGYEDAVPRNFLGLGWIEDWHYIITRRASDSREIVVVLLPQFNSVEETRFRFASLVRNAMDHGARGIAFDYFLERESNVDRVLCQEIERAESVGVRVIFGYRLESRDGTLARRSLPPTLAECISESQLGSLSGYREADGLIRMVPLFVARDTARPAFSHRIAASLDPAFTHRGRALVQFTLPRSLPTIEFQEQLNDSDLELFRGRFVVVGSNRTGDRHATPYGTLPGVVIHAATSHGLRTGELIRRLDHRWAFPVIFVVCFILVTVQAHGGRKRLFGAAALFIIAIVTGSVLAMVSTRLWIDASYPIVAVLGMTGLLHGGAAAQRGRKSIGAKREIINGDDAARSEQVFDVFLSHNGKDKEAVRILADALVERGIKVWLDERELIPGRPWQEGLEAVVETVRSAAILVGPNGLGPWEIVEMRASLEECVRREMPVIPVLLPGTADVPPLPLFLRRFTWVDLRSGLTVEGVNSIEWGVTGIKPVRA